MAGQNGIVLARYLGGIGARTRGQLCCVLFGITCLHCLLHENLKSKFTGN